MTTGPSRLSCLEALPAWMVATGVLRVGLHVGLHVGVHTSTLHADCQAEQEAGQCGLVSHVSHLTSLLTTGQTDDGERIYRGGPR